MDSFLDLLLFFSSLPPPRSTFPSPIRYTISFSYQTPHVGGVRGFFFLQGSPSSPPKQTAVIRQIMRAAYPTLHIWLIPGALDSDSLPLELLKPCS